MNNCGAPKERLWHGSWMDVAGPVALRFQCRITVTFSEVEKSRVRNVGDGCSSLMNESTVPYGTVVQEICKPGSVLYKSHPLYNENHSSRAQVTLRLEQPTRELGRAVLNHSPIWSCSGWGLPGRPCYQERRCALTAPFHRYSTIVKQSPFCCTCLRVTSTGCYPASCPVEPGLSSRAEAPAILFNP